MAAPRLGSHHLGLEAVRLDLLPKMFGNIEGDGFDTPSRLRDAFLVCVAAANLRARLLGLLAEEGLEEEVERLRALDVQLGKARLVVDGDGGAVVYRLRDGVRVDEAPEDTHRRAPEVLVDRCAGEANERRLRHGRTHLRSEAAILCAVRLVDHDDDVVGVVEVAERARRGVEHVLEFLDGRHDCAAVVRAEQLTEASLCWLRAPVSTAGGLLGRWPLSDGRAACGR